MDFKKEVIEMLNTAIFNCESNIAEMSRMGIESKDLLSQLELSHNIYTNFKHEIEVLIEENKSSIS